MKIPQRWKGRKRQLKLTPDEVMGIELLNRVWDRMQEHGRYRDGLKTKRAQNKCVEANTLFESMVLVSRIRGRIRHGKYR